MDKWTYNPRTGMKSRLENGIVVIREMTDDEILGLFAGIEQRFAEQWIKQLATGIAERLSKDLIVS